MKHNRQQNIKRHETVGEPVFSEKTVLFLIFVLAAVPFCLGRFIEFNSPDPFDSGSYVHSAQKIITGAKIGVDEIPSADLGTLLVNMLGVRLFGFSELGPKIIQTILQGSALFVMFLTVRRLFGLLPAAMAVIIASVYLSAPVIAKFGNVKEQYMTACMVLGACFYILYQLGGKWWQAILSGFFLAWSPLLKPIGLSVVVAAGFFIILQPFLRYRSWSQTVFDILLLLAGAAVCVAPLYIWIIGWDIQLGLPYAFIWKNVLPSISSAPADNNSVSSDYIADSRKVFGFLRQFPIVMRYYAVLILPIALAIASIAAAGFKAIRKSLSKGASADNIAYDRFIPLLAVWWLLDMAFVWISPHSYEQYYIPLNASAAMLGGYIIALYRNKLATSSSRIKWQVLGFIGFIIMILMSWNIFVGLTISPYRGTPYGARTKGYAQRLREALNWRSGKAVGSWEFVADSIRKNSDPNDRIYVWGWYPGIYVRSQRLSASPRACEANMHFMPPEALKITIDNLLAAFKKQSPKFIVDSHKMHFPFDRPPFELWPIYQDKFIPNDPNMMADYDTAITKYLGEKYGQDESLRYEAMLPLRRYVMENYDVGGRFGEQVLFRKKIAR